MAAVLAQAKILSSCAPFGVAYAAACCSFGSGFCAVIGTFVGYLLGYPGAEGVKYAGASLIVMTAATVFSGVGLLERRWFLPVAAGASVGVTGFLFLTGANFSAQAVAQFLLEMALCGCIFVAVYGLSLWLFGMNRYERELVARPLSRLLRRG